METRSKSKDLSGVGGETLYDVQAHALIIAWLSVEHNLWHLSYLGPVCLV